jgi:tetratricopeptide (TPR) repeat protein
VNDGAATESELLRLLEHFMRVGFLPVLSALFLVPAILLSPKTYAQSGAPSTGAGSAAGALQPADASSKYAVPGCPIDHTQPGDADKALAARKYADAERLYNAALAADPNSSAAMAGLVRTTLAEGKLSDALAMATKYSTAHPTDAVLMDAVGEVRFRRGEIGEAAHAINQASRIDGCNGHIHYDAARFLKLSGLYASAQHELEIAHAQSPDHPEITRAWRSSHAVPPTAEQRLATLKKMLDNPSLTDAQRDGINAAIKGVESNEKGSCELVAPIEEVKLPIIPVPDNGSIEIMNEAGLDVQLNGKKKRLEIDTGASGMVLSSAAAKSAGLTPEYQIKVGGFGDDGLANAFVTHVDDIKIGKMEFHNCMVQVLAPGNTVERMADVDGLIGPDVFRDYLVTLDYPGRELRLGPLPRTPDEQVSKVISLTTSEDVASPVSYADSAKDRYVAPEMKDWSRIFRSQHMLIVPTLVNNTPIKLFLLDTGSSMSFLSPSAAKEVGQMSDFTNVQLNGVNGVVRKVPAVGNVSMTFALIKQTRRSMLIVDTGSMSRNVGAEMSGIIGFPILRELVLSIDYRDNLIHVVYDPKKGYHATNDNGLPIN